MQPEHSYDQSVLSFWYIHIHRAWCKKAGIWLGSLRIEHIVREFEMAE